MSNPFDGIITQGFKDLHKNAIDALIDGCSLPCTIEYTGTKVEDCPNCYPAVVGGVGSTLYQDGGPIPFHNGHCPMCNGTSKKQIKVTEEISLVIIWDYKDWYPMGASRFALQASNTSNTSEVYAQTISKIDTFAKLKRANTIILEKNIETLVSNRFQRFGEPEPCGFGASNYVFTMWEKVNSG